MVFNLGFKGLSVVESGCSVSRPSRGEASRMSTRGLISVFDCRFF